MFDKFGELDSADEINELAENLLNEGDIDGLEAMAKENGIPMEYVLGIQRGRDTFHLRRYDGSVGKD